MQLRIALVGDFDPNVVAHRAIPRAIELAAAEAGIAASAHWLATDTITSGAQLTEFGGIWCVPASPYRSTTGALRAIRYARERGVPFLGTCGGFQHAVLEYAQSVLGWHDAEHAETAPGADVLVVTPLACSLVEVSGTVRLLPGSRLVHAYGAEETTEGYHCRYGLNPAMRDALTSGPLRVAAEDAAGDVRAVELDGHPFFVATLFQPERAALVGVTPPIVSAFVAAIARCVRTVAP